MSRPADALLRPATWAGLLTVLLAVAAAWWFVLPAWQLRQAGRAAQTALAEGDFAEARRQLNHCLQLRPNDPALHLLAAQAARRDGNLDEAQTHLDAYRNLADSTPASALEYAMLASQRGEVENVQDYLIAQLNADHPAEEQILEALALGCVRVYHLDRGAFWIEELLKQYPRNPVGRLLKAQTLQTLGNEDKAKEEFASLVEDFPRHVIARRHLVSQLMRTRQYGEAVEHLSEAAQQLPGEAWPLIGLLRCYRQLSDKEKFNDLLAQLKDKFPEIPVVLLETGRAALENNRPVEAEEALRKAVKLSPSDMEIHYQLALALRRNGKIAEADQHAERFKQINTDLLQLEKAVDAMRQSPNDPAPRVEAGRICFRNEQEAEALRWSHGALQINPKYGPAHALLAEIYQKQGDDQRAAQHRRQAGP